MTTRVLDQLVTYKTSDQGDGVGLLLTLRPVWMDRTQPRPADYDLAVRVPDELAMALANDILRHAGARPMSPTRTNPGKMN